MVEHKLEWACAGAVLVGAWLVTAGIGHGPSHRVPVPRRYRLVQASFQEASATSGASHTADGAAIYKENCASCHQANRAGSAPDYPSLVGIGKRYTDAQLSETISQGTTTMLAFPELKPEEIAALVRYLKTADLPAKPAPPEPAANPPAATSDKI